MSHKALVESKTNSTPNSIPLIMEHASVPGVSIAYFTLSLPLMNVHFISKQVLYTLSGEGL